MCTVYLTNLRMLLKFLLARILLSPAATTS